MFEQVILMKTILYLLSETQSEELNFVDIYPSSRASLDS
jgi:hypothetical protein